MAESTREGAVKSNRERRSVREACFVICSAWMFLWVPSAVCQKAATTTGLTATPAPSFISPATTIALEPLGYKLPRAAPPYEFSPSEEMYFVDPDHLLVTFRVPELLDRLPDCPPTDEDRTIHAVLLDVSSGRVEAAANWRLHDHLQYLWPLSGGRFLVRQHNRLMVTDPSLKLHPFLRPVMPLESVQVSQDGKFVVVETAMERHNAADHQKLVDEAKLKGTPPPKEDVRVLVVDSERRTVVAESRETQAIPMHLIRDGYVDVVPHHSNRWQLRYATFGSEPKTVIEFASKCDPQMQVLNSDTLVIVNCPTTGGGNGLLALSLEGKPLWSIRPDRSLAIPHFTLSAGGNTVALSRIRLANPVDMWVTVIHDDNILGQQIDLLDATSGKVRMEALAKPARIYGQDYALSPDGQRLAVLKTDQVEVYDVPPPPEPAPTVRTGQQ